MITIHQLRMLTAIMAEDEALWAPATYIETAYTQQALRFLTRAIEGNWSFEETNEALKDMQS